MDVLSLSKSLVKYLRDNIITGEFHPGQKLNEIELASDLNISRAPLREAFYALENEHLITRIPRKGAYVTEISNQNMRELYTAREMIECYAIDLLESENVRDLPDVYSSLDKASNLSWPPQFKDQDKLLHCLWVNTDFHVKLVASARNQWLISFYDSIVSNLARYQFFCIWLSGQPAASLEMHKQIYDLLRKGAYSKGKKALMQHIEYTVQYIEQQIGEEPVEMTKNIRKIKHIA